MHGRKSKRKLILDHVEQLVPWIELLAPVVPHYSKTGNRWYFGAKAHIGVNRRDSRLKQTRRKRAPSSGS